mmetsp:Transcript_32355/g.58508  ORF Transcript_32355/g.58508 Transcript_32355/m.58508 type:complete len:86 (-) Transcript_32355:5-262(-)
MFPFLMSQHNVSITVNGFLERVGFSQTVQKVVFIPKRPGETKMTVPRRFLRHEISGVILLVAFVLGVVIGRNRGGRNRAENSQIS